MTEADAQHLRPGHVVLYEGHSYLIEYVYPGINGLVIQMVKELDRRGTPIRILARKADLGQWRAYGPPSPQIV